MMEWDILVEGEIQLLKLSGSNINGRSNGP